MSRRSLSSPQGNDSASRAQNKKNLFFFYVETQPANRASPRVTVKKYIDKARDIADAYFAITIDIGHGKIAFPAQ